MQYLWSLSARLLVVPLNERHPAADGALLGAAIDLLVNAKLEHSKGVVSRYAIEDHGNVDIAIPRSAARVYVTIVEVNEGVAEDAVAEELVDAGTPKARDIAAGRPEEVDAMHLCEDEQPDLEGQ